MHLVSNFLAKGEEDSRRNAAVVNQRRILYQVTASNQLGGRTEVPANKNSTARGLQAEKSI